MADKQVYTQVYDLDYYCLTDDNFLLCNRSGKLCQIKPSEFLSTDKLFSIDQDNDVVFSDAIISSHKVLKGEKIVRLVTQRGTFYLTTGHKMFLEDGTLIAAGNLKAGNRLKYTDKFYLPNDNSIGVDKAYLLGAFAAEGSSQEGYSKTGNGKWRLTWNLHENEDIFAAKIGAYILSAFPGSSYQIDTWPEYTRKVVASYSKDLVLIFKELGALGLCYDKRVPGCIFTSTKHEKAAFLAGILEGDATFNDRCVVLKLTSKALIDGTALICEDLGINTKLGFSTTDNEDNYTLKIYGKENLNVFLQRSSQFLQGWKHLSEIKQYAESKNGNIKYSRKDIQKALELFYPTSCAKFSKLSGISQSAIRKVFGSWNKCLQYFDYPIKKTKWAESYIPKNNSLEKKHNGFDFQSNQVVKVDLLSVESDILVYDFSIPVYKNFLLNTVCSHNSGSQCEIYIGDVWVDEVTSISYTCQQMKTPIYGYASQLWDDCAAGHVIVQGNFTVNFKEQGYLWAVLRRYHNINSSDVGFAVAKKDGQLLNVRKGTRRDQPELTNKYGRRVGSNGTNINRQTVERVTQGEITRGDRFDFYQHLAGYSTFKTDSPRDKAFEDIVEAFEDQVWQPKITNSDLNSQLRRVDDNTFDGFDIYIIFGNYANPRANHTVVKLIDVRLISHGKQVVIDGAPVQESYNFLARTIA